MAKRKRWPGFAMVALGSITTFAGAESMSHGDVAGGPMIWALLFGGSFLMVLCGLTLLKKSK